jgi:hypothetical protein
MDTSVVSIASQGSQAPTLPLAATEEDSAAERTTRLVENNLTQ